MKTFAPWGQKKKKRKRQKNTHHIQYKSYFWAVGENCAGAVVCKGGNGEKKNHHSRHVLFLVINGCKWNTFFLASFLTKALFDVNGRWERTRTSTNASPVSQWVPSVKQWWWIAAQNCCWDSKTRKSSRWWNLSSFFSHFTSKKPQLAQANILVWLVLHCAWIHEAEVGFALGLKFAPSREREEAAQRVSEIQPPTSAHQVSASPFSCAAPALVIFFLEIHTFSTAEGINNYQSALIRCSA